MSYLLFHCIVVSNEILVFLDITVDNTNKNIMCEKLRVGGQYDRKRNTQVKLYLP